MVNIELENSSEYLEECPTTAFSGASLTAMGG
jgi:hypothetical protein